MCNCFSNACIRKERSSTKFRLYYVLEEGKIVLEGKGKELINNDYAKRAYLIYTNDFAKPLK